MASRPPFGAIFGHFWPFLALFEKYLHFWALFGHFGREAKTPNGSRPKLGKWGGSQNRWVPRAQVASRPPFGAILSHFEPFWAFFDPCWPFGGGQRLQVGPDPLQFGVKWGEASKLAGREGPSGV